MNCPGCRNAMLVLEYEDVEIDFCASCEGIWLDAGELELLFGDAEACRRFVSGGEPGAGKREKPRRCPICGTKMAKSVTRGASPVTYDACRRGDGLWFDKGELASVLEQGALPNDGGRVGRFLREVFGHSPE